MKRMKSPDRTLAATLDRTQWDYSPRTDRSFLLRSVRRLFASVSWEAAPQHLTPAGAQGGDHDRVGGAADDGRGVLESLFRDR